MNDIYKIVISFVGFLENGVTTRIYHEISEDDTINDGLLQSMLAYYNATKKVTYNQNIDVYNHKNNTNLQPVEIPADYKRKAGKEYDNIEQWVNDAVDIKNILFDKGRNVCVNVWKGEWGVSCCEECGWSYQWEIIKTIEE
jgi:hypothetical protein